MYLINIKNSFNKITYLLLLFTITCFSQNTFKSELALGSSLPNLTGSPVFMAGLSYEHINSNKSVEWQSILNHPITGVGLYYFDYRNSTIGKSISLIPFIAFRPSKNYRWLAKMGIGASYFSTKYHPIYNETNQEISTNITWAIQGIMYYNTLLYKKHQLQLGLGIFHHSNGHTKLPNNGINTLLLSAKTSFSLKKLNKTSDIIVFDKATLKKHGNHFYSIRYGDGFQAFVASNIIKPIYTVSIKGGFYYKNILKLSLGTNIRYYQHYYDYITIENSIPFVEKPIKNASNIIIFVSSEMLLGHIGTELEMGINIFKPFYETHYYMQKSKSKIGLFFKKVIPSRFGLKFYAINTKKKPKNNFYIGAHINANFVQADFSEISIGYIHNIFR